MARIYVNQQLEILPSNKIIVPGCEPSSSISSNKLSFWLAKLGCADGALINVNDALNAIPGSYIKYGLNNGRGTIQRWFVLPSTKVGCPCPTITDWYAVLRALPIEEQATTDSMDHCDFIDPGFCMDQTFVDSVAPPPNPYKSEGEFPAGAGGFLPPVPPWM